MRRVNSIVLLAAVVALSAGGTVSWACFMYSPQPVQVWMDHINVEITDQVAVKTYDCTFLNPNPRAVVGGMCYMELEPGAQVDDMSVLVNGKEMKAEILDVNKAKEVFDDIVKRGGSPALLEFYGNQLIRTQVPRVSAGGTVTVKLTYTTVLPKKGGLVRLQVLNTNPKAWASEMKPQPGQPIPLPRPVPAVGKGGARRPAIIAPPKPGWVQPLKSASVSIKIRSKDPIKNIYSPTHDVKVEEHKDWDVVVNWKEDNYTPKHPFVLYYQQAGDQIGASLLAHREPGEEGHFMLMLSPTIGNGSGAVTDAEILPKDVIFCVDTSGSMLNGNKMEQAKAALKYCVDHLRPGDRFNIVDFSTGVRAFRDDELVTVSETTIAAAQNYVKKLHARGGTAIKDALESSLKLLGDGERLKMIVFATDGFPTIGEREPQAILKGIANANKHNVRIFVFGEGFDVNTKLLDFLALNNRGEADYVLPKEDIAKKISRFYDRVGSPIMTDLKVEIDGVRVKDMFPAQVADIYRGEQVILYGRYDGSGKKKVVLTGTFKGQTRTFEYDVVFPEVSEDDKASFVPRLWAGKKVDYLLNELRKTGKEDKELIDEITYLAKRYGIVTPYTSFLMAEDIAGTPAVGGGFGNGAPGGVVLQRLKGEGRAAAPGAAPEDRADAVKNAKESSEARRLYDKGKAGALYGAAEAEMKRRGQGGSALTRLRYIGSRTFYRGKDAWYEGVYDANKHKDVRTVKIRSDEYFKLMKQDSRIAKYLALGDVVLQVKGNWYRFVEEPAKQ